TLTTRINHLYSVSTHLRSRQQENRASSLIMSGEDLCNVGPLALLQDLAAMAALGINSVERNGHHYLAGLSQFPASTQQQIATSQIGRANVCTPVTSGTRMP